MKTIEYRASYGGTITPTGLDTSTAGDELIRVQARTINSGYAKALRRALEPLGSGARRELLGLIFWQVV
jgi:hypothetical protein